MSCKVPAAVTQLSKGPKPFVMTALDATDSVATPFIFSTKRDDFHLPFAKCRWARAWVNWLPDSFWRLAAAAVIAVRFAEKRHSSDIVAWAVALRKPGTI